MASVVSTDSLTLAIMEELTAYSDEVADIVKDSVRQVAQECAKEIKTKSPIDQGEYKKGWRVKVAYENRAIIRTIVHNNKKPQITHLLENGHAKKSGGRVEGKAHIKPAEQNAEKKLVRVIEETLS